ncbi:MAG: DUF3581 domain-containing protein [Plesiomonas sp.]|uniref:DUF3581 domain-containing protein n=1 Tax=Plesiomonas sp. TaxID=2486279 RepID=UPI003EE6663C
MFLTPFYHSNPEHFYFSREQASDFAKKVAGDFNPIHDTDAKRFCVPGDLLFALTINKLGLSQKMHFDFAGMVTDGVNLTLSSMSDDCWSVTDQQGKNYLNLTRTGNITTDKQITEQVIRSYVAFSGMNFPHIMVPLMEKSQHMIHPTRPLVIYESMTLEMDSLDFTNPTVKLSNATMDIEGKRGNVTLEFIFSEQGKEIGVGRKRMVASGLMPYQQEAIDDLIQRFEQRKTTFMQQGDAA